MGERKKKNNGFFVLKKASEEFLKPKQTTAPRPSDIMRPGLGFGPLQDMMKPALLTPAQKIAREKENYERARAANDAYAMALANRSANLLRSKQGQDKEWATRDVPLIAERTTPVSTAFETGLKPPQLQTAAQAMARAITKPGGMSSKFQDATGKTPESPMPAIVRGVPVTWKASKDTVRQGIGTGLHVLQQSFGGKGLDQSKLVNKSLQELIAEGNTLEEVRGLMDNKNAVTVHSSPPTANQIAFEEYKSMHPGTVANVLSAVGGVAEMGPAIAAGAANPALGLALFGVQGLGGGYNEALAAGSSPEQAVNYGGATMAEQVLLAKLLSGIPVAFGKSAAASALEKGLAGATTSEAAKRAAGYVSGMATQGAMGYAQSVLDPILRNATLGENNEVRLLSKDAARSAAIGAATAGIVGLPGYLAGEIRARRPMPDFKVLEGPEQKKLTAVQPEGAGGPFSKGVLKSAEQIQAKARADVDKAYPLMIHSQQALVQGIERAVGPYGFMIENPGPKSAGSVVDKVVRKAKRDPDYNFNSLKDHMRAAVIMHDLSDVPKTVAALKKVFPSLTGEVFIDRPLNQSGYRGIHLMVDMGNGLHGEIQLSTSEAWRIKKETDAIYEKWRNFNVTNPKQEAEMLADYDRSSDLWNAYYSSFTPEVRRMASDSVIGLESQNSSAKPRKWTNLDPSNTYMPSSDTANTRPSSDNEYLNIISSPSNVSIADPKKKSNERWISSPEILLRRPENLKVGKNILPRGVATMLPRPERAAEMRKKLLPGRGNRGTIESRKVGGLNVRQEDAVHDSVLRGSGSVSDEYGSGTENTINSGYSKVQEKDRRIPDRAEQLRGREALQAAKNGDRELRLSNSRVRKELTRSYQIEYTPVDAGQYTEEMHRIEDENSRIEIGTVYFHDELDILHEGRPYDKRVGTSINGTVYIGLDYCERNGIDKVAMNQHEQVHAMKQLHPDRYETLLDTVILNRPIDFLMRKRSEYQQLSEANRKGPIKGDIIDEEFLVDLHFMMKDPKVREEFIDPDMIDEAYNKYLAPITESDENKGGFGKNTVGAAEHNPKRSQCLI